ncbi:hypothetical protein BTIS_1122 [Bifidobacterium tissieri]|uniref:Uncharacterized protein n=1 Tax=Bifidobacterium tissieri TaxID=1630162 RepID=A0A261FFC3_9BIFI|nr:hypothetical protein [Bifidobacterium tissieri]OZG57881.1 hypothetical protein BTIS_1122 [Bifidobacterium tissieri]
MTYMGYRNIDRVFALAERGKLSKIVGDNLKLNELALGMMCFMGKTAIDKEDTAAINEGNPYWCYWLGWDATAAGMGLILPTQQQLDLSYVGDGSAAEKAIENRTLTARNRLSRTAKFLRDNGCVRLLRPATSFAGGNKKTAIWMLCLGEDDAENDTAERWARRVLHLRAR